MVEPPPPNISLDWVSPVLHPAANEEVDCGEMPTLVLSWALSTNRINYVVFCECFFFLCAITGGAQRDWLSHMQSV